MSQPKDVKLPGTSCPLPLTNHQYIQMAHGGGGRLMHDLIEKMLGSTFSNPLLDQRHDSAVFHPAEGRLAMTTDSFVVRPLFFPGGNIGSLAVHGTVNDLAMCGARPLYLSLGLILEEGLPIEVLWQVVQSIQEACAGAGVQIITGDTKVVDRGKGDGIYINTTGIGVISHDLQIRPSSVRPGDRVILSGDLARHGIAIMNAREDLGLESEIESDSASVVEMVHDLLDNQIEIHCLRDLTRGGLASALLEISELAELTCRLEETRIPVREDVRGACEILGLEPIYIANEGRFIAIVAPQHAEAAVELLRRHPEASEAAVIGSVVVEPPPGVLLTSQIGIDRVVDMLSGEQLPRIC